ncbi:preprotein translocase subunit SecE [Phenylobacterium soli]|uniref:Protein translocase subunit SecE n=1 Tax=Phenylobacterium soli TaxID=2170551 RepID=A0A328AKQ7_9CAUL|nr:preprotein translocase subunit SecE [Phenylobacterium soli]RAK55051.1 preprotein translocase subunit SecE [Phenylobacterium soli]
MARKPGQTPQAMRNRAAKTATAMSSPSAVAQAAPKKRTSISQFAKEVRVEARRITWTSRRETWITSVMVAIMVVLASLFFFLTDASISWAITQVLKLASGG